METAGSLYSWEFENGRRKLKVALSGPLTFNEPDLMLQAAIDGLGVAYVLEHEAALHIGKGRLVQVLEDWCPPFAGVLPLLPVAQTGFPCVGSVVEAPTGTVKLAKHFCDLTGFSFMEF
jgi:hypothetical protein